MRLSPTFLAFLLCSCSFDTARLRGDAARDRVIPPVDTQDISIDTEQDATLDTGNDLSVESSTEAGEDSVDVAFDASDEAVDATDTMTDVLTDGAPEARACSFATLTADETSGTLFGNSLVITGSTVGAMDRQTPSSACLDGSTPLAAPDRIYRYVVQRGPSLHATTSAGPCAGVFDSVLSIRDACERDAGSTISCNDDDNVLPSSVCSCSDAGISPGCTPYASSTTARGLRPGDTVYIVVDGYSNSAGAFQLTLTENGVPLAPAQPPTSAIANRCGCSVFADGQQPSVNFPSTGDTFPTGMTFNTSSNQISGTRTVTSARRLGGIGLELDLQSNSLSTCRTDGGTVSATFDLLVNNVVVHSFLIEDSTPLGTIRVPFHFFSPQTLPTTTTNVPIVLRMRTLPSSTCRPNIRFGTGGRIHFWVSPSVS